jgi:hypothetical protein
MKRKILAIAMSLAVLATMALPMSVWADTGDTVISGTQAGEFTLQVPGPIAIGAFNAEEDNLGNSSGLVETNSAWTMTVTTDHTADSEAYMNNGTVNLTNPLDFSINGSTYDTFAVYKAAIEALSSGTGSIAIPLYIKQLVETTDATGSYTVTITYTASPS